MSLAKRNEGDLDPMLIYLQLIETEEDKSKFEQIYLEYRGLMYHVAYKLLQHEQDAEDAVHQAFIKIAENITKIGEPMCPKTKRYVVIIVESKSIDMLRHRKRHPSASLDEVEAGIHVPYDGDDVLVRCILQLPARQRQVIWLKYYHGYTLKEIARILNITLASAIKIDQRAKSKLRTLCEEGGVPV